MPTFAIGFKCEPADEGMEPLRMEFLGSMAAELLAGESSAPLHAALRAGPDRRGFLPSTRSGMKGLVAFLGLRRQRRSEAAGGDPGRGKGLAESGDRPRTVLAAEKVDAGPEAARAGQPRKIRATHLRVLHGRRELFMNIRQHLKR